MARKFDREIPLESVLVILRSVSHRIVGPDGNGPALTRSVVDTGQEPVIGSAVNDLRIVRVGSNPGTFATCG